MTGYVLSVTGSDNWMFLGTSLKEAGLAIAGEIDDLEVGDSLTIKAVEISQGEIDKMPEFQGW